VARPTLLTDALTEAICAAIRLGQPLARAAVLCGLHPDTVRQWVENGRNDDGKKPSNAIFATFARLVEEAHAACEHERLRRIEAAGKGGALISKRTVKAPNGTVITEVKRAAPAWQADCWTLERRYRDDYALRSYSTQTHELSDAMAALIAMWQELRDHPELPRQALPEAIVDAEVIEMRPQRRPAPGEEDETFTMLDRLNHPPGTGGWDEDE
jgi:hypothetical protein